MPRKNERLVKRWRDWSAGMGHLRDDGRTQGFYYSKAILGGAMDLRPAQLNNAISQASWTTSTDLVSTFFFDDDGTAPFLYVVYNRVGAATGEVAKVRLDYTNFGDGTKCESNLAKVIGGALGRPVRYQGKWYVTEKGGGSEIYELTTISAAGTDDAWSAPSSNYGSDHLAALNHQVVRVKSGNGVAILGEDQMPDDGTWGSFFACGDKEEIAADLFAIGDLIYVLKPSGLYSFGERYGRTISGMVLEDYGHWRAAFDVMPTSKWKGGAVIPHPSGLLYYTPGEAFVPIGIEAQPGIEGIVPSGATELEIGRYHGTTVAGDYLYTIYQPDPGATGALILCGHAPGPYPSNITWQCLGGITLAANVDNAVHGIHCTALGFPEAAAEKNPTLWFTDAVSSADSRLGYIILDSRGQPLRGRANTHKVTTSGDIWMSELQFDEPINLSRIRVYTEDMAAGDEWLISAVYNGTGSDQQLGKVNESGYRDISLGFKHKIYRFMLHVNFTGTDATARVPPTIKRIELYGPERE